MTTNPMDLYAKVISEQKRKEDGILDEAKSPMHDKEWHQVTPAAMKQAKEFKSSEVLSKGKDHEIHATPDEKQDGYYYHGHVNGKKFSVRTSGSYETHGKNYNENKHLARADKEVKAGLKAHGISGEEHDKVFKKIQSHAHDHIMAGMEE